MSLNARQPQNIPPKIQSQQQYISSEGPITNNSRTNLNMRQGLQNHEISSPPRVANFQNISDSIDNAQDEGYEYSYPNNRQQKQANNQIPPPPPAFSNSGKFANQVAQSSNDRTSEQSRINSKVQTQNPPPPSSKFNNNNVSLESQFSNGRITEQKLPNSKQQPNNQIPPPPPPPSFHNNAPLGSQISNSRDTEKFLPISKQQKNNAIPLPPPTFHNNVPLDVESQFSGTRNAEQLRPNSKQQTLNPIPPPPPPSFHNTTGQISQSSISENIEQARLNSKKQAYNPIPPPPPPEKFNNSNNSITSGPQFSNNRNAEQFRPMAPSAYANSYELESIPNKPSPIKMAVPPPPPPSQMYRNTNLNNEYDEIPTQQALPQTQQNRRPPTRPIERFESQETQDNIQVQKNYVAASVARQQGPQPRTGGNQNVTSGIPPPPPPPMPQAQAYRMKN
ncbi:hypothetical protein ROZALSC1DRAFT_24745 [Rozella allomycis CSF55]|uniref:Uncharacterized protein n=1 Tax=Rozella allomycis (strain CSF55) TaxID=988480 RepID=A0A4P9YCM1_ROZAC|nr:hypothetical protein ROZALSC1DRAFT_24745 [Rozella allomycis CSF55]